MRRHQLLSTTLASAILVSGCAYHSQKDSDGLRDLTARGLKGQDADLAVVVNGPSSEAVDGSFSYAVLLIPLWIKKTRIQEDRAIEHYPPGYLIDQIRKSGWTRSVTGAPEAPAREGKYTLKLDVESSQIREMRTTYGLSFVGGLLQVLLGLPSDKQTAEMSLQVKLVDSSGTALLERSYTGSKSRWGRIWAPLWLYGPQFSFNQHRNVMARTAEELTEDILRDVSKALSTRP
jgi:hypothetical protein